AEVREAQLTGPELIQETTKKIVLIKQRIQAAQDRQKSYADLKRKPMEFEVRDKVMLNVSPWKGVLRFVEFAYNNSWHASIKCAPFELLYGRKCRAPICWDQVEERVIEGPEMIEVTNAKVTVAKEKLKEARTRQKSYADKHRRSLEFQPEEPEAILDRQDRVMRKETIPFVKILWRNHPEREAIWEPEEGYKYHPLHVISYPLDQIRTDLSYVEEPEAILDRQDRVVRKKNIPFVKILWRNHPEREATWETEESIRTSYPHFLP
nr:hypothetical protein [Tanacetum cinerariifolium]